MRDLRGHIATLSSSDFKSNSKNVPNVILFWYRASFNCQICSLIYVSFTEFREQQNEEILIRRGTYRNSDFADFPTLYRH